MSRMIDDEEELKDYELIEKCSNLVIDENKCLDTWDDENADYKECKRINCHKKQLKRLEAENKHLKKEVETWSYQAEKRAEIGDIWYDTAQKYKQALEDIKDRLIVVTEEEPQSTINLVLDLKLIIEKILKGDK